MARSKKGVRASRNGKSGSSTPNGPGNLPSGPQNCQRNGPFLLNTAFTLADEARQTSLHDHSSWGEGSKLRKNPVQFISAGRVDPFEDTFSGTQSDEDEGAPSTGKEYRKPVHMDVDGNVQSQDLHSSFDDNGLGTYRSLAQSEDHDPLGQDVENVVPEVIVNTKPNDLTAFYFDTTGEKGTTKSHNPPLVASERSSSPESTSSSEVILFRGRNMRNVRNTDNDSTQKVSAASKLHIMADKPSKPSSGELDCLSANIKRFRTTTRQGKKKHIQRSSSDEDILADYINNMRDNGELDFRFSQVGYRDLGATDGEVVIESGQTCDESEMVSGDLGEDVENGSSSVEDVTDPSDDGNDDEASEDDSGAAALVKLIAAHDLSSDHLLPSASRQPSGSRHLTKNFQTKTNMIGGHDFDLLDWERPSLRRQKKGKRFTLPVSVDNCDSELEKQLQTSWRNDRLRKKERKKQREELRALGMFQGKASPDDLRVKYPSGMTIDEVSLELRVFLQNRDEVLSFPPMDLHARKVIHELANKFNIKSKSTGKAEQRRPTLYRTKRTLGYGESAFDQAVGRIHRRFLPRLDTKGKRRLKTSTPHHSHTVTSYQEGEVVGAAAPELGIENRGRAMLEKMGWSRGTALGAVDNKGILQPVTHTMKRSKAGLG